MKTVLLWPFFKQIKPLYEHVERSELHYIILYYTEIVLNTHMVSKMLHSKIPFFAFKFKCEDKKRTLRIRNGIN